MYRIAIVAMCLFLSSVAAQAQYGNKVALSGSPIELGQLASVNPDCSDAGRPVVRVTQSPEHGRLIITKASIFPYFRPINPRSDCNWRCVPGVIVKYVSERGYVGSDSVALEAFFPNGTSRRGNFNIMVR
ncbi:hypothetical protein [Tardiphaga sp. 768_D3_N2_1]|uniref:hypothetical protein n=1 Tax=Tardiphaga sp. 768_D3_N2_1 TaxID=3240783 RepID=UPI003F8B2518